jgi:uncharacterized protein YcgI (DUF1989 family)
MNELAKAFEEATRRLVKKYVLATEKLTEEQLADVIRQAIEAGDFQRLVNPSGEQAVSYIPFAAEQRRKARVQEIVGQIEREVDWLQHFPDQCGDRILALCKQIKGVVGTETAPAD